MSCSRQILIHSLRSNLKRHCMRNALRAPGTGYVSLTDSKSNLPDTNHGQSICCRAKSQRRTGNSIGCTDATIHHFAPSRCDTIEAVKCSTAQPAVRTGPAARACTSWTEVAYEYTGGWIAKRMRRWRPSWA